MTAYSRGRVLLIMSALLLSTVMASLDSSFLPLAFPDMIDDLDSNTSEIVWVALGYLVAATGPMLLAARMADAWGHVRLFQAGTVIYSLAMIACTFAPDVPVLIGLRLVAEVPERFDRFIASLVFYEHLFSFRKTVEENVETQLAEYLERTVYAVRDGKSVMYKFNCHKPVYRAIEPWIDELLRQALERTQGNQSAAARLLGMSRDQIRYRMQRLGLLKAGQESSEALDA